MPDSLSILKVLGLPLWVRQDGAWKVSESDQAVVDPGHRDDGEAQPWETLRAQVTGCKGCGLWEGRTQAVFGVGNPNADLVIVGGSAGLS